MSRNTEVIPFFRPYIRRGEIAAIRRVLRSGWLTTASEALAFETEFASFLEPEPSPDRPPLTALAVNSCTSGLHLALEAVGTGPGDLVAVPSFTFTASAEVVRYLGADPLFIDSDPRTGNMDPESLRIRCAAARAEGRRIRAVMVVHLAGRPADMAAITRAVEGTGAAIIEDSAHAFPSRTAEGPCGCLGDIGVYSFYATKTITTGEGGMIVTRDARLADRMRIMRLHGIDRTVWNRYSAGAGGRAWEYDVVAPGFKYNMTDLAAAVGRVQLSRAEKLLSMRRDLAEAYGAALSGIEGLELPEPDTSHAWHLYIVRFPDASARDRAAAELGDAGVGISVHFIPLHRMTFWKDHFHLDPSDFPVAEDLADRVLSLPLWPGMPRRVVRRVSAVLRETLHG